MKPYLFFWNRVSNWSQRSLVQLDRLPVSSRMSLAVQSKHQDYIHLVHESFSVTAGVRHQTLILHSKYFISWLISLHSSYNWWEGTSHSLKICGLDFETGERVLLRVEWEWLFSLSFLPLSLFFIIKCCCCCCCLCLCFCCCGYCFQVQIWGK